MKSLVLRLIFYENTKNCNQIFIDKVSNILFPNVKIFHNNLYYKVKSNITKFFFKRVYYN